MSAGRTLPVAPDERAVSLDILRGVALLGILFVNVTWFTGFAVLSPAQRAALGTEKLDAVLYWLVHMLVDSKFWSLFALMFGVGFAIQAARARARGLPFRALYVRRMVVLLLIGLAHAVFIWFGDIVSLYAAVGLVLVLFHRAGDRTLLAAAVFCLVAPILINGGWLAMDPLVRPADAPPVDPGHGPAALFPAFASGTWTDVFHANWAFLKERWARAAYTGRFPALLGLFLLGACIGRRGLFRPSASHVPLLRKVLIWGLAVGLPANAILAATAGVDLRPPTPGRWVLVVIRTVGVPALSLAWAAGIMLLLHRPTWRSILKPFAAVGRLSFTNYLLQSVAGVAIGYGVGLGTWGRIGMAWSIVLIFALFAVQVLFSLAWLRWFRFGPVEWVWRCLAYGRVLPIRAERSASAALESA